MFKKILVPLDGSEIAEAVVPFAQEIARKTGGELRLVTAVQQVGVWDATLSLQVMDSEEKAAHEYLQALGGAPFEVIAGDAAEAILSAAERYGSDLIAVSTHGRSGLARWIFGSTASRLLEASPVPVLFLRPKEGADKGAPGHAIRKILVPLDGSEIADGVLDTVTQFAKTIGATLVLCHAVAPITAYPGFETTSAAAIGGVIEEMQEQAKEILARSAQRCKEQGVEATAVVIIDVAVDGILRVAEDTGVDLIALGTHGRGGLGRMVLGSVADGVVRRSADVPCLVIRPQEKVE